jgi:hypothetical protein
MPEVMWRKDRPLPEDWRMVEGRRVHNKPAFPETIAPASHALNTGRRPGLAVILPRFDAARRPQATGGRRNTNRPGVEGGNLPRRYGGVFVEGWSLPWPRRPLCAPRPRRDQSLLSTFHASLVPRQICHLNSANDVQFSRLGWRRTGSSCLISPASAPKACRRCAHGRMPGRHPPAPSLLAV